MRSGNASGPAMGPWPDPTAWRAAADGGAPGSSGAAEGAARKRHWLPAPWNGRSAALACILRSRRIGVPAADLLPEICARARLSPAERGLARELAGGAIRHAVSLDLAIGLASRRSVDSLDEPLREVLRQGAYQMLFLDRIPPSAAVDESVKLAKVFCGRSTGALANAVLRKLTRLMEGRLEADWIAPGVAGGTGVGRACGGVAERSTRPPGGAAGEGTPTAVPSAGAGPDIATGARRPANALYFRGSRMVRLKKPVLPSFDSDAIGWLSGFYGFPRQAVEILAASLDIGEVERVLRASNEVPPVTVRLNRARMPAVTPTGCARGGAGVAAVAGAGEARPGPGHDGGAGGSRGEGCAWGPPAASDGNGRGRASGAEKPAESAVASVTGGGSAEPRAAFLREAFEGVHGFEPVDERGATEGLYRIEFPGDVGSLPGYRKGLWTVQDAWAARIVLRLDLPDHLPREGLFAVDMCAAPGGKATAMAERLAASGGRVLACDSDARRLEMVAGHAERLGLDNLSTRVADGRTPPEDLRGTADIVLLDAPCTNLAVMGRRWEVRQRVNRDAVAAMARLQGELLDGAALLLKPRGLIVYSTCTLAREENGGATASFLARHGDFRIIREETTLPAGGLHDGGYVCIMERR
ncbi:MAG: hypothetical protein N3A38_07170 [Planctomycetota bacterium]|nr:hypothetical protein [Planctomycetota bacterium]